MSPNSSRKAVVLLSGGLDSATTLYLAKARGYLCHALILDYGQRHRKEVRAARKIARAARVPFQSLRLRFPWGGSALTDRSISVPVGRSLARIGRGIPPTYVPARNTIFLSLALAYAEAIGAQTVFIGANAVDFSLAEGSPILILGKGYVPIEKCRPGDFVVAMDPGSSRLQWHPIRHVIEHPYVGQPMFRLVTEHGRSLVVSGGHSLYTLDENGHVCPTAVSDLHPGDFIVSAGKCPIATDEDVILDLPYLLRAEPHVYVTHHDIPSWLGQYRNEQERGWKRAALLPIGVFVKRFRGRVDERSLLVRVKTRGEGGAIPACFKLTDDWAFFLGLWLADGSFGGPRAVQISCNAQEAQKPIKTIAEFFHAKLWLSPNGVDRAISSVLLVTVMKSMGFVGTSRTKRIPPCVFNWPKSLQAAFIKGYIVGDGSIDGRGPVTVALVNSEMIRGLHDLLLNLGVVAYRRVVRVKKTNFTAHSFDCHFLVIENSCDKKLLLQSTGEFSRQIVIHETRSKIRGIPVYSQLNTQLKSFQAGRSITLVKNAIRNNAIYSGNRFSRSLLSELAAVVPDKELKRRWSHLADNDIVFSKIRLKESLNYQGSAIYDLSVPDCENFLVDGVIAHNSGYPDCRPSFYRAMQKVFRQGTRTGVKGRTIRIATPLIRMTKAQIIRLGKKMGVPYELTWSCYQGRSHPCGLCDSCLIRAKGFRESQSTDPAKTFR